MRKVFTIMMLSILWYGYGKAQNFKNCFYITLKGDTVNTTIFYTDIINLQHELQIVQDDNTARTFKPDEIKGFGMRNIEEIELFPNKNKENDIGEFQSVYAHQFLTVYDQKAGIFPTKPSKNHPINLFFESISISGNKLFIQVKFGTNGSFHYLSYYYSSFNHDGSTVGELVAKSILLPAYTLGEVDLIEKDNILIDRKKLEPDLKLHLFFYRLVTDYQLLAKMVKDRKLNINDASVNVQVPNAEMIINDYNDWKMRMNKSDTSATLRGIMDADKYYRAGKINFLATTVSTSAFILPGLVVGQLMENHPPKEKSLNIPLTKFRDDANYIKAYKMRAYYKKSKSLMRGIWVGGILMCVVVIPLLVITG